MVAQLGDMAVGGRGKFDIDQVINGAINNTIAAFSPVGWGKRFYAKPNN